MKQLFLFIMVGLFFYSCYDDKSSDPSIYVPDFKIDTTGIPLEHKVTQYGQLTIKPKIVTEEGHAGNFSYKWMLNTIATTTVTTGLTYANYICIGEEKDLDAIIELSPKAVIYYLWYQVTDEDTKLRRDIHWRVLVQTAYNEGLLLAETSDNKTSDLSVIEGSSFTLQWNGADKISRHIYSTKNGNNIDGVVTGLGTWYASHSSINAKQVTAFGDGFYEWIDGNEYASKGRNGDVLYDATLPLNKQTQFFTVSTVVCWVVDGKIFPWSAGLTKPGPNIQIPYIYQIDGVTKNGSVDKYVAYVHISNTGIPWGAWYDKNNGVFLCQMTSPNNQAQITTFPSGGVFNPNNSPDLETCYAALGYENNFYFVMKNKITSEYNLYVLARSPYAAKSLHTIPGDEIASAKFFVIAENANVFYFATEKDIYSVVLTTGTPYVTKVYTLPQGTITSFTMFRHAWAMRGVTNKIPLDNHENMLLVGGYSGTEGTLYAIPILNPASATLNISGIKTYSGFGKITAITTQE